MPQSPELSSDIWMGPPDWWEEYEANKECNNSLSSDVSSVIEVTTMYLGSKKTDPMSTSQSTNVSTTSTTSATSTTSTTSPPSSATVAKDGQLKIESLLARRQSSPSLSLQDEEDDKSLLEDCGATKAPIRLLHKSSSCKSVEINLPKDIFGHKISDGKESRKSHKTAWDRVKDIIIHARKDSMKRKARKEKAAAGGVSTEPEESSEIDMEAFLDDQWGTEFFAEGLLSRSTPKSSPMVIRQHKPSKSMDAGAMSKSGPSPGAFPSVTSGTVDMAALLGKHPFLIF